MKKTKKLVCLLLTCLLLCSVFMLPAGAQEQQPDQAALLQVFKTYLDENDVEYKDWEELVSVEPITQSNGWTVFFGHSGVEVPMSMSEAIGEYIFFSMNCYVPYDLGLYAEKNGTVLTLKEAYEAGEIDIDAIAQTDSPYINARLSDEAALLQAFGNYLNAQGIEYGSEEGLLLEYITDSNGWAVFCGAVVGEPAPQSDRIGDYVFFSTSWYIPYKIGLFAEKDGVVLTLKEAYEAGEIDIDAIAQTDSPYIQTYLPGDADMDGEITVEDILTVQKITAKKTDMDPSYAGFNLCDYTGDQVINVQDVLAMQKYIAKVA